MNKKNVISSINTIERAAKSGHFLAMREWQRSCFVGGVRDPRKEDLSELLSCNTPACFAGLIAVSDDFKKDGGRIGRIGQPVIENDDGETLSGHLAIAYWLGIDAEDSIELCTADGCERCSLYGKHVSDITHDDVLEVLYRLRDTGSIWEEGKVYA